MQERQEKQEVKVLYLQLKLNKKTASFDLDGSRERLIMGPRVQLPKDPNMPGGIKPPIERVVEEKSKKIPFYR